MTDYEYKHIMLLERIANALEEQNRYTADFEERSKARHEAEMKYLKENTVGA